MAEASKGRLSRLGWGEKLGFGVGDLGFNLYWTTIASFLAAFYTDVFGLSAAAAGTLLLVTKIVDACTDPLMGAVADRTASRWGQFRPYLLFAGVPMAAAAVLTFTTPDLDEGGKLIWAYATYTAMMLAYTVLSTPYSALSGVMTANSTERTTLISVRFLFAFTGGALVNKFTLPLVGWFGGGDAVLGWQCTMALYGAIACLLPSINAWSLRRPLAGKLVCESTSTQAMLPAPPQAPSRRRSSVRNCARLAFVRSSCWSLQTANAAGSGMPTVNGSFWRSRPGCKLVVAAPSTAGRASSTVRGMLSPAQAGAPSSRVDSSSGAPTWRQNPEMIIDLLQSLELIGKQRIAFPALLQHRDG